MIQTCIYLYQVTTLHKGGKGIILQIVLKGNCFHATLHLVSANACKQCLRVKTLKG